MVTTVRIKNDSLELDYSRRTMLSFEKRETHLGYINEDSERRDEVLGLIPHPQRDSPIASSPLVQVRALDLQTIPEFSNPVHLFEEVVLLQRLAYIWVESACNY